MIRDASDLEWILEYEISSSARHRRFISLVMISPKDDPANLEGLFENTVRDSDVLFFLEDKIIVLMGDTDKAEASKSVDRFQEAIDETNGLSSIVMTYPNDGNTSAAFLSMLK